MTDRMNRAEWLERRRELRQALTPAEAVLWRLLKGHQLEGLKFRRQQGIGPYIVDFYCPKIKLAIELDGEVHNARADYDERRAAFLAEKKGIHVLRFENRTVFESPWRIFEAREDYLKDYTPEGRGNPILLLREGGVPEGGGGSEV